LSLPLGKPRFVLSDGALEFIANPLPSRSDYITLIQNLRSGVNLPLADLAAGKPMDESTSLTHSALVRFYNRVKEGNSIAQFRLLEEERYDRNFDCTVSITRGRNV
jgi:hypothetical protein